MKMVTIKDVAREAEVSVASVSRALNGVGRVGKATRERVISTAERLRYVPHEGARSLITRRTDTIGVILPDLHGEFFSELLRGMDLAARAHGLHLLVSSSHGNMTEAAAALRAMRGRVDGLVVMSAHFDGAFLDACLPATLPAILVNTRGDGDRCAIAIDDHAGAGAMVRHLAALGRTRIAHIAGPADNDDAAERHRGYRDALVALGLSHDPALVVHGDFRVASGQAAGRALAALPVPPDAIFAANDMMATGCLDALREAGLSVPHDVAVGGFDDVPIAQYLSPPLTTMRTAIADLGRRALDRVVAIVESPDVATTAGIVVVPQLVIRASCGHGRADQHQEQHKQGSLS